jgi:hypothetical protein
VAVGCFVSSGRSLDAAVKRMCLAEGLGYEAAYQVVDRFPPGRR